MTESVAETKEESAIDMVQETVEVTIVEVTVDSGAAKSV